MRYGGWRERIQGGGYRCRRARRKRWSSGGTSWPRYRRVFANLPTFRLFDLLESRKVGELAGRAGRGAGGTGGRLISLPGGKRRKRVGFRGSARCGGWVP